MKKYIYKFLILLLFLALGQGTYCKAVWINDMRALFQANNAILYSINIRTFNANDVDGDGIVEDWQGEERGSFFNAIKRLDEVKAYGVNTILLMPVTPVGKVKAIGTAGSLYAPSSFSDVNPQLKSPDSGLSAQDEMLQFVNACHDRGLRVIVDLPACGAYDLYIKHPELFSKDSSQNPIVPGDWTDVRLLNAGDQQNVNQDVYNLYKNFINLMLSLDVDGVRADVASIKPYVFWKKLIEETRRRDPQFLFLAETLPEGTKPLYDGCVYTSTNSLLDAGFDGVYGKYSELANWKTSNDFFSATMSDYSRYKKSIGTKSVLGNFSTHDQISPFLLKGADYSKMIIWLSATLPLNSYFVDGFPTGDDYLFYQANKKAVKTYTDDEYYFVHRGQFDIFNFSRMPMGKQGDIFQDFLFALRFKKVEKDLLSKGNFVKLHSSENSVFAFSRSYDKDSVVVIGNLDLNSTKNVVVRVPKVDANTMVVPIKVVNAPKILSGRISTTLAPSEIQVLLLKNLVIK